MALTRTNLKTRIRTQLGQSSAPASGPWQDSDIESYLDEAVDNLFPDIYIQKVSKFLKHQLDNCEDDTNWSEADDGTTPGLSSSDFKEGSNSVTLGADGGATTITYSATPTSIDTSSYDYVTLWLYFADEATLEYLLDDSSAVQIRVGSASNAYKYKNIHRSELKVGWNAISIAIDDMTDSGTPDMTAVDYVAIVMEKLASGQTITLGDIKMDDWAVTDYMLFDSDKHIYPLPSGCVRVTKVEKWTEPKTGTRLEINKFKKSGQNLVFDEEYPAGQYMRLYWDKKQVKLTADASTLDLSDDYANVIVWYCVMKAWDRLIYDKIYLGKHKGTLTDVLAASTEARSQYSEANDKVVNRGDPVDIY